MHAGIRAERFGGEATLAGSGYGELSGYNWTGEEDWGFGYVVGGAYEIPEMALRVALTYGSEIRHELDAEENFFGPSTTEVTMPQSVNLDFQTGVAPKTLLYGLVRWVNWAGWKVEPQGLFAATGLPLVEFDSNAFTYKLGIGRQFTDALSAGVEAGARDAEGQDDDGARSLRRLYRRRGRRDLCAAGRASGSAAGSPTTSSATPTWSRRWAPRRASRTTAR